MSMNFILIIKKGTYIRFIRTKLTFFNIYKLDIIYKIFQTIFFRRKNDAFK